MNYAYIRYSTEKQDEQQQMNVINKFSESKGLTIDKIVQDEGVSGGVSYKDRNLYALIQSMKKGDALITTEISRLGRSMSDLNKLINDELKPREIRLIVVQMAIDLNCANITALDEMILFAFSFAAQLEKELIQSRTKNALEARKKAGKEIGGTNRLWGKNTGADRTEALCKANAASVVARRKKAQENPNNKAVWEFLEIWQKAYGKIDANSDFTHIANELNARGKKTATGLEFNANRARVTFFKLKEIYVYDNQ